MYAFDSDLTLEQMQSILNAAGPWQWEMGDSYWYGDYLRTRPNQDQGKVAIMEQRQSPVFAGGAEDPRYLIWATSFPERGVNAFTSADVGRVVREKILPAVGARSIQPAEGF